MKRNVMRKRRDGDAGVRIPGTLRSLSLTPQLGYEVHDWEQGVNLGPSVDHDLMLERLLTF
jgi:hypothetical protein